MMVSTRVPVALAGLLLLLMSNPLQAQTPLKYQFKPGTTLHYVMVVAQKMTQSAMGMEETVLQKQTVDMSWNVLSVDDKGAAKIRLKFDRVRLSMENAKDSREVVSDVKEDPTDEPEKSMTALAKAIAKIEGTFTITPLGEIQNVAVPESIAKEMKDRTGGAWSEEALQAALRDNMLIVSREPLAKGLSWKAKVQALSPFGKVNGEVEYVYEGPVQQGGAKVEKLAMKPKLKIDTDPKAMPPVTIKSYETEGTAYFDNASGRLVDVTMTQRIEAQAEVKGTTFTQKRELTNSIKLTKVTK